MAVFNSTQTAFRASVTQTDVLEGGRAAMDLMAADLRQMAPSLGESNSLVQLRPTFITAQPPVNFYAGTNSMTSSRWCNRCPAAAHADQRAGKLFHLEPRQPERPARPGSASATRVYLCAANALYSLYRFYITTNVAASPNPAALFNIFMLGDLHQRLHQQLEPSAGRRGGFARARLRPQRRSG